MNVIHGEGKPRIIIDDPAIHTNTVLSATSSTVTLTTAVDLTTLDAISVVIGRVASSYNSSNELTRGKITAFDDSTNQLTVESWNNGTPANTKTVTISYVQIDLPYCQSLIEKWTPDFIYKKRFNGDISRMKRGYYYSAFLDYSGFADSGLVSSLRGLYLLSTNQILFYPRVDNLSVVYNVDISPDTEFQLMQAKRHSGHKLTTINLVGVVRLSKINLQTPSTTGYGDAPYGGSASYGYGDVL